MFLLLLLTCSRLCFFSKPPCGACYDTVAGNGFLYNMVRIIAGTLVQIGLGRTPSCQGQGNDGGGAGSSSSAGTGASGGDSTRSSGETIAAILEAADRSRAGPTAPAAGLCLEHVEYDRPWGGQELET